MLVRLGCTKTSQMWGRKRAFISHPEAGRPRGRCWPIGVWEYLSGLSMVPSHYPRLAERERTLVSPLLTRAPIPPWGPHPLYLISPQPPPMGPPANPPTWGGGWGFVIWIEGGCSVHSTKWISCYGGPRRGHMCLSGQCHGNSQTDAVECLYFFHGCFVPANKMRQKPKPDKHKGSINC